MRRPGIEPGRRADYRQAHSRNWQRRTDRRPLRGKFQGRIAPECDPERGRGNCESRTEFLMEVLKMKATQALHSLGQSIWLDNITRDLLDGGTLSRYIDDFSVTGLTSNPTIFDHAIKNSTAYDAAIREKMSKGKSGEGLF